MDATCPICNNPLEEGASACSFCGYKLLGSTIIFEPIKMEASPIAHEEPMSRFDMKVVRGPQTGMELELRRGNLTVGRDPRCDIFLNDMTVSRDHAVIEVGSKSCIIRDNNSVNGVWVNDRVVELCELKSGDSVQIGAFCLVYREKH